MLNEICVPLIALGACILAYSYIEERTTPQAFWWRKAQRFIRGKHVR